MEKTVTVEMTFDATRCVDVFSENYDPWVDVESIMGFGHDSYNLIDWKDVTPPENAYTIIWNTSGDVCMNHVQISPDELKAATIRTYAELLGIDKESECDLVILAVFDGHLSPTYSILESE